MNDKCIYRYSLYREKVGELREGVSASAPEKVAEFMRSTGLASEEQEHLVAIALNAKNIITGYYTVSIGMADYAVAGNREIFRRAVVSNALGLIISHNHPSNDCEPSSDDIRLTESVKRAGEIIGIKLLDHVIVT